MPDDNTRDEEYLVAAHLLAPAPPWSHSFYAGLETLDEALRAVILAVGAKYPADWYEVSRAPSPTGTIRYRFGWDLRRLTPLAVVELRPLNDDETEACVTAPEPPEIGYYQLMSWLFVAVQEYLDGQVPLVFIPSRRLGLPHGGGRPPLGATAWLRQQIAGGRAWDDDALFAEWKRRAEAERGAPLKDARASYRMLRRRNKP